MPHLMQIIPMNPASNSHESGKAPGSPLKNIHFLDKTGHIYKKLIIILKIDFFDYAL
jgi:hypothetical protein